MQIWNSLKKVLKRAWPSWSPSDDRWYYPGGSFYGGYEPTKSGADVNEYTALNYSAVFSAISLIAGTIGSLPLHLYKLNSGSKEKALSHPLYDVLHSKANSYMTAMNYREATAAHIVSWGNSYSEIGYDRAGRIVSLWPITPNRVSLKSGWIYEINLGTKKVYLSRDKILHIPGLGFDGYIGYSVLSLARESIALGIATEEFGARWFGSGTHPGTIVSHPGKLSQEAHDNLKRSLVDKYSGLGKAHKLLLLEEGMKIEKIGFSPEDSQFLATRQFQIPEIARWFNVPCHKLHDLSKSSFDNIASQQVSFVVDSIRPWLVRIEQNYNMQLLTDEERRQGYFFEHSVEGLLRGDSAARAEFYSKLFNIGVFSINEIREFENKNPIDGGDERYVPLNMIPISQVNQLNQQKLESKSREVIKVLEYREDDLPEIEYTEEDLVILGRERLQNKYLPIIENIISDLVAYEVDEVRKAIEKHLQERNMLDFESWLEEFYTESFNSKFLNEIGPYLRAYAESISEVAAGEIGVEYEMTPEIEKFINDYIEVYSLRYTGASANQIKKLMGEADPEDVVGVLSERLNEWIEKRPLKEAGDTVARVNGAITRAYFKGAGITKLIWVTRGAKPCIYCCSLHGKVVGIDRPFLDKGLFQPPGAEGQFFVRGPHYHPPIHRGCRCMIRAG